MKQKRRELFDEIWREMDEAYALMDEYDTLPHHYGSNILYQTEAHVIDLIAQYPDVTITGLACILRKTPSACSQIVRKLKDKGWVEQIRNEANNRLINLSLTEAGQIVYRDHTNFNLECQERTYLQLDTFAESDLEIYLRIQAKINETFHDDVRRSREYFA